MTWWLFLGTVATSILSAVFGLVGGTLLFVMLAWVVDVRKAIFLHSVVQLVSTLGRILAFYPFIRWQIVVYFSMPLLIGGYLGVKCVAWLPEYLIESLVAGFILLSSFFLEKTPFRLKKWHWIAVGVSTSFLGIVVAITGPFISIFFNQENLTKEEQLVTKSVCHALTQLVKISFFSLSFDFSLDDFAVSLVIATIIGTFIGTKLLKYFSEKQYRQVTYWLLRLIAISLLLKQFLS